MKTCPRCEKTYPDSEQFCENDGTALVGASPAFVQGEGRAGAGGAAVGSLGQIECPTCGGKAEPGEIICNYCGTRLSGEPEPATAARTPRAQPQPQFSGRLTSTIPQEDGETEESGGRNILSVIAYVLAALIALAGGAYLALHLSSHQAAREAAKASPSPSPAAAPMAFAVTLAQSIPIQVTGAAPSAPERSAGAARTAFESNSHSLLDSYRRALASDPNTNDGMLLRLEIASDGSISAASVRTSTAPNPSLDADVVKDVSAWKFAASTGTPVDVDYPLIFARTDPERASVESALKTKMASLSPTEAPEYASTTPAPGPSTAPSAAPSPAVAVAPASPAAPATPASERVSKPRTHPRPRPTPSLRERVQQALRSNRSLGRVRFYTDPGGTVVLFGKVYDDSAKRLAERTVRNVPGVTAVNDTLTTDVEQWASEATTIQQRLANAGLPNVTVKVIGSDAYLSGTVKTPQEKQRAVTITEGAAPVVVRGNLITIEPGRVFGF
jgi:BON domain